MSRRCIDITVGSSAVSGALLLIFLSRTTALTKSFSGFLGKPVGYLCEMVGSRRGLFGGKTNKRVFSDQPIDMLKEIDRCRG